ncbi:MAG: hypothetical protein RLZZ511_2383 [Cyanobacteriota bacterium]
MVSGGGAGTTGGGAIDAGGVRLTRWQRFGKFGDAVLLYVSDFRGVAQFGSVPLWGSGGRGFKSRRSD